MLLDSNVIIYAAQPDHDALREFIRERAPGVSVISRIEVLGYHKLQKSERSLLERFFNAAEIFPLSDAVVEQAVRLRQQRRMTLGDSIVAATAIVHGRSLVTHNTKDFEWIEGLVVCDPMSPGTQAEP